MEVPEILISGDHKKIDEWRKQKQIEITKELRPDLLEMGELSEVCNKEEK